MIRMAAGVIALLAISIGCAAAEESYSAAYTECMDRSGGVTVEMLDCIADETRAQDERLNSNYQALAASLSAGRRQELRAVQRLWIQYRDANCKFYADPEGGSIVNLSVNSCFLRETAERADELELLAPR